MKVWAVGLGVSMSVVAAGLVVVGCAQQVDGSALPNELDRAAYVTEASRSSAAATTSKIAAAKRTVCTTFDTASRDAQTKLDTLKRDIDAKAARSVLDSDVRQVAQGYRSAADQVEASVRGQDGTAAVLKTKLDAYVPAARTLAAEYDKLGAGVDDSTAFNRAQDTYFSTQRDARIACI